MFNHPKQICTIYAILDKHCLWPNCVIKKTEYGSFLRQSLSFNTYKSYIITIFTHLVLQFYKTKIFYVNLWLLLMLLTRVSYTVFAVRQSYQRGILRRSWNEVSITNGWDTANCRCIRNSSEKRYYLFCFRLVIASAQNSVFFKVFKKISWWSFRVSTPFSFYVWYF